MTKKNLRTKTGANATRKTGKPTKRTAGTKVKKKNAGCVVVKIEKPGNSGAQPTIPTPNRHVTQDS